MPKDALRPMEATTEDLDRRKLFCNCLPSGALKIKNKLLYSKFTCKKNCFYREIFNLLIVGNYTFKDFMEKCMENCFIIPCRPSRHQHKRQRHHFLLFTFSNERMYPVHLHPRFLFAHLESAVSINAATCSEDG